MRRAQSSGRQDPIADVYGGCFEIFTLRLGGDAALAFPIERITLAGFPPTRVFGGTSLVTTDPAATTEFSPTVTPPIMVAPAAIQTFLSITMGFAITPFRRWEGSMGWPDVMMLTFGPIVDDLVLSAD